MLIQVRLLLDPRRFEAKLFGIPESDCGPLRGRHF